MEKQEQQSRVWVYQLPSGEIAENMKEGRTFMSRSTGHNFSSESFRSLVKKGVIKKITRITDSITPQSDAKNNSSPSNR